MRIWLALAVLLVSRVGAANPVFAHHDHAGLVLSSDEIVVAERVAPSRYHVVRVLHGRFAPGQEIEVHDAAYDVDWPTVDTTVVLFLVAVNGDPAFYLVQSGLRVVRQGRVYRFEDRFGAWKMVPQGHDPNDLHRPDAAPVDLATLEREIGVAQERVAELERARLEPDPAVRRATLSKLVALASARGGGQVAATFACQAEMTLVVGGDVEGAVLLDVARGAGCLPSIEPPPASLVAVARDVKQPVEVRVAALGGLAPWRSLDVFSNADVVRGLVALLGDGSPAVRAAVVAPLTPGFWGLRSPGITHHHDQLAREARAALDARFAIETDRDVRFALASSWDRGISSVVTGPGAVARAQIVRGELVVEVRRVRRAVELERVKLVGTRDGVRLPIRAELSYLCGSAGGGRGLPGAPIAPAPGSYRLALTFPDTRDPIELGALNAGPGGELTVTPQVPLQDR
jgi:hypothetical protein